jgi:voltage-gated potassium channel
VRYIFSFNGLVDLAATAPFYLQILMPGLDLRVLRILRLVRVFKLSHYSTAIEDLFSAVYQERKAFIAAIYLLLIAVILTSSLMYFAETTHQPDKFGSIPDAIYWSLITLTTVGYGDVSPVTGVGKIIAVSTAFMGVCVVALLTGIVASAFANQITRRKVIFESQLREALKDGTIDEDEQISLENLRVAFNLSEEQVAEFYLQAQKEQRQKKP